MLSCQNAFIYPINKKTDSILIITLQVTKYEKIYISYAFIQSIDTKCIVPFTSRILHYKNIATYYTIFRSILFFNYENLFCTYENLFCIYENLFCTYENQFCTYENQFCTYENQFCTYENQFCTY